MTRPEVQPDDWNDLAEVWTAPQDGPDMTADLVRSMRRRAGLARLNFLLEIGGCLFGCVIGAVFAVTGWAPIMGVAALTFSLFSLILTLWARRGAEPGLADSPAEALRAAIRQARSGQQWARAGQAITVAAGLFVTATAVEAGDHAAPLYLPLALLLLGCLVFYERHARRATARMAGHAAALAELEAE